MELSNLPIIPLLLQAEMSCFWSNAFGFSMANLDKINKIKSTLSQFNTNLSSSQKELLLWHQRLSHASILWVQMLMRDKSFLLCNNDRTTALHKFPFIKSKSCAPTCNTMSLKCEACLCAKAAVRLPINSLSSKKCQDQHFKGESPTTRQLHISGSQFLPSPRSHPYKFWEGKD